MTRILLVFFGKLLLIALAMIVLMLLTWHLRLGENSPGILALGKEGLSYWVPLFVLVFFIAPSMYYTWRLFQIRQIARTQGLTLSEYLSRARERNAADSSTTNQ
jgi:hypothetical protein